MNQISNAPTTSWNAPSAGTASTQERQAVQSTSTTTEINAFEQIGAMSESSSTPANSLLYTSAGAPQIDGVTVNFSAEDMAAVLTALQSKTQDAQIRTAKEGLEVSKKQRQDQHEKVMNKLNEWIKKCESAEGKSKISKVFGWVSKIASFVASAIATVALVAATGITAGAASPLLALAVMGLVGSTMSLASSISQEFGGPALELSALSTLACKSVLTALGVPEKLAESIAKVSSSALLLAAGAATGVGIATLAMDPQLLGNLAGGIAELGGADAMTAMIIGSSFAMAAGVGTALFSMRASGITSVTTDIGKKIMECVQQALKSIPQSYSKMAQASATVISGAATATSGGLGIAAAKDQYQADSAQADRKKFSALIVQLQAQMQEEQEQIQKLVQELQDSFTVVSQMIAAAGESRVQIASNLTQRVIA